MGSKRGRETMATPSDAELEQAVKVLKAEQPDLGAAKVRTLLKERHSWEELSEKRVKKAIADVASGGSAAAGAAPARAPPAGAPAASSAGRCNPGAEPRVAAGPSAPTWAEERPSPRGYFSLTAVMLDDKAGFPGKAAAGGGAVSAAVIFGGEYYDGKKNVFFNQLFALDPAAKASARGTFPGGGPSARSAHQTGLWEGNLFVFGGEFSSPNGGKFKLMDDMWQLVLSPAGGEARRWDKVIAGDKLVVYGGMGESKYFQDLHVFHLPTSRWTSKAAMVTQRQNGGGPAQEGLFLYGGTREKGRGTETLADLWRLDLTTFLWERIPDKGVPPGLVSGVGVGVAGRSALLFGGVTDEPVGGGKTKPRFNAEVSEFNMDTRTWTKPVPAAGKGAGPSTRRNAQCTVIGTDLLVMGGLREEGGDKEREVTLDDLWALDVASIADGALGAWRCVQPLSGAGTQWFESDDDSDGVEGED
ncbi:hypothetical protein T484DRAFT_1905037 [Baffinella frigidus]|nr:hypothetical protein T484DRAFT_1905037 [Cryptophyta sp. CCMP2293]